MKLYPIIGLEVHIQLKTKSKMFCESKNIYQKIKNKNINLVDLGIPGTLPIINKESIKFAIELGLSINGKISNITNFSRKHYFYPDLPKGYQISQYDQPFAINGNIELSNNKKIKIRRVHMEEDTAKLIHQGEISLIDGEPRSATAVALEKVTVIMISRDDFIRILRENPQMALKIMVTLCQRLRRADKHVESLAFLSAPGRVAQALIDLVHEYAPEETKNVQLPHKITRQEFASMAGTSRETLTRVLMDFQEDELITIEKNLIIVHDTHRLKYKVV